MTIKIIVAGTVMVLMAAGLAGAAAESMRVPFAGPAFVSCANDGVGEIVDLSGTLHIVTNTTEDANGGLHTRLHFQPQGAIAIGQVTGDTYRTVGVTQQTVNIRSDGFPVTDTFVNNFRLIGPGTGNNLLVHQVVHMTINANGETTADVSTSSVECR